eukprot:1519884-Rhodomonas_salina.1
MNRHVKKVGTMAKAGVTKGISRLTRNKGQAYVVFGYPGGKRAFLGFTLAQFPDQPVVTATDSSTVVPMSSC